MIDRTSDAQLRAWAHVKVSLKDVRLHYLITLSAGVRLRSHQKCTLFPLVCCFLQVLFISCQLFSAIWKLEDKERQRQHNITAPLTWFSLSPFICIIYLAFLVIITFRVRRSQDKMYSGHAHLCVCLSVPRHIPTLLHGPGCNLGGGNCSRCPLVVHYWADLQSVYGFRCYDNIAPNAKCQRVLVLALCLVTSEVTTIPTICNMSHTV